MDPCGAAARPADAETAEENLERAYARHRGTSKAIWLPPEVVAQAADKAADAASGVIALESIKPATSYRTKWPKNRAT